jgi:membrane-associated phospholipid phosphatase
VLAYVSPIARRPGPRRAALAAAALVCLSAAPARAGDGDLTYDWKVDGAITAAAVVVWGGTQIFQRSLAPTSCHWCDPGPLDSDARDALRWSNTGAANTASNLGAYVFMPLATVGVMALGAHSEGRLSEMAGDALVIAEAVALAGSANQIVKLTVGRERPFVHALPPSQKPLTGNPSDNNLSFYSGHTSFAFSLAVSTGTVASIRHYRWAPVIWGVGLAGATAVGYLRIAADKHYLTDVVTGAAVGGGFGFVVPYEFHRRAEIVTWVPVPGGGMLTFAADF